MRNMSFMLTTAQIRNRTKTVTRRVGWRFLKPGDVVRAVEKGMGLKKGEKVKPLAKLLIEDVRIESLNRITVEDCAREGFPELTPEQFVEMFRKTHGRIPAGFPVTRIEFSYLYSSVTEGA